MGCDIHLYVEKRVAKGNWVPVDKWIPDKDSEEKGGLMVPYDKCYYFDRNYNLFAILADVRNGRGFAGTDTGEGFNPISVARGLPSDVSTKIQREFYHWGNDAHSVSFHTVKDLLEYDWTQVSNLRGVVSAVEYYGWKRWNRDHGEGPEGYCADVGGTKVLFLSPNEMDRQIQDLEKRDLDKTGERCVNFREMEKIIGEKMPHCYCRIEWKQPYYKTCRSFWSDTIPRLLRLGKPEDVRIVFWFDN